MSIPETVYSSSRHTPAPLTLDVESREVWLEDLSLSLEPRAFDLLAYLVANRDRIVSREELFIALWGGSHVGDRALSEVFDVLLRALGDDGRGRCFIRSEGRIGYRFVHPVIESPPSSEDRMTPLEPWRAAARFAAVPVTTAELSHLVGLTEGANDKRHAELERTCECEP